MNWKKVKMIAAIAGAAYIYANTLYVAVRVPRSIKKGKGVEIGIFCPIAQYKEFDPE